MSAILFLRSRFCSLLNLVSLDLSGRGLFKGLGAEVDLADLLVVDQLAVNLSNLLLDASLDLLVGGQTHCLCNGRVGVNDGGDDHVAVLFSAKHHALFNEFDGASSTNTAGRSSPAPS